MQPNQKIASNHQLKIVLAGGGSGGHITPLLPLAQELKAKVSSCEVTFIGLAGGKVEKGLQSQHQSFDRVCTVTSGKFRRYHGQSFLANIVDLKTFILNIWDLFKVLFGILQAWRLLGKLQPDLVFSKGGYAVVPVGAAARLRKIPIITHDSDAVPGLANRIVGRWASWHATGMPARYYDYPKETVRYSGTPVGAKFAPVSAAQQAEYKEELGIDSQQLTLLVGGAGLGSRDINNLVLSIVPQLTDKFPSLFILHITGDKHELDIKNRYRHLLGNNWQKNLKVIGFTDEFYKFSGAADLVVSRAGATTIAELAAQAKAAVIIPATFLPGGHQQRNAEVLKAVKAAKILSNDVTAAVFLETLVKLLGSQSQRQLLAKNLSVLARPEAASDLADLIIKVARNEI